jgi:hypothetical protein
MLTIPDPESGKLQALQEVKGHQMAKVAYELVVRDDLTGAYVAYLHYQGADVMSIRLNLEPMCSRALRPGGSKPWMLELIRYFLVCGSDRRTITVVPGDKYIHAVVKLSLLGGEEFWV